MTDSSTSGPVVGVLFAEIAAVLNDLGTLHTMDGRIAAAATVLGQINTEWASNPTQAGVDTTTLIGLLNSLSQSYGLSTELANAIDCAEQLNGTWSGNDYVQ